MEHTLNTQEVGNMHNLEKLNLRRLIPLYIERGCICHFGNNIMLNMEHTVNTQVVGNVHNLQHLIFCS